MELEDYKISEAAKVLENANLIKKYHANLVYDYTEYPTKGIWKETMATMTQILLYPDYEVIHVDSYLDSNSSYDEKIVYTIRGPYEVILCYIYKSGFEITSHCYYESD